VELDSLEIVAGPTETDKDQEIERIPDPVVTRWERKRFLSLTSAAELARFGRPVLFRRRHVSGMFPDHGWA
jgi:hypothetical protein